MNALTDILYGLSKWRLWTALAFNDIRMRYKKSWIGIGWVALSTSLFLAAKIFIFSNFSAQPLGFFAVYLATGFMVWRFMSSVVMESTSVYFSAAGWIKSEPIPYSTYIFQLVYRNFITLLYSSLPVIVTLIIFQTFTLKFAITFFPVILIYLLNAVWVGMILGVVCGRFRDLAHLIQTAMQIMFFLTPVIWVASDVGKLANFVRWNPLAHFLAIFRDPLLYSEYPVLSWQVVGGITVVGWIAAIFVHARFRKQVVFWI